MQDPERRTEHTLVTRSILSPDALQDMVARHYDVGAAHACTFLGPTTNDHYLVETATDRYVLRLYCVGRRSPADIAYELDALVHLRRAGAPVAFPIAGRDGQLSYPIVAPEGERVAVLFSYAPGKPAGSSLADDHRGTLVGRTLAELHRASDDFLPQHPRLPLDLVTLLEQPLQRIEPYLRHRPDDLKYLVRIAGLLHRRLTELSGELAWGFCHGDFHGWNIHLAEDGLTTIFDFDNCGPGWRAYDLATYLHNLGLDAAKGATWQSFRRSYAERRPISEADAEAVPLLVAICEFWLMGGRAARVADWGILGLDDRLDRGIRFLKRWETEYLQNASASAEHDG